MVGRFVPNANCSDRVCTASDWTTENAGFEPSFWHSFSPESRFRKAVCIEVKRVGLDSLAQVIKRFDSTSRSFTKIRLQRTAHVIQWLHP